MCRADATPERKSTNDVEALTAALDVFVLVGKVSSLFAWMRTTFFGARPAQMVVDAMVHADLALAISACLALLKDADGLIERDINGVLRPVSDLAWRFPVAQFTEWKVLAKMLTDQLARMAVSACVESMAACAESLGKVTPPWEFLHDGAKFHMKMAARRLVNWHAKKELNEGGVRLEQALKGAAERWASWGFPGKLEEDALYAEQMATVTVRYRAVHKAMTLAAIVKLVHYDKPCDARNTKARALVAPQHCLDPQADPGCGRAPQVGCIALRRATAWVHRPASFFAGPRAQGRDFDICAGISESRA